MNQPQAHHPPLQDGWWPALIPFGPAVLPRAVSVTPTGPPPAGAVPFLEIAPMTPLLPSLSDLQTRFLLIAPRLQVHGRVYFRSIRCPNEKAERIAEMLSLAWLWFLRLCRRGKDPLQFPSALATFAARAVNRGRRLCGQEKARDVLSPRAQRLHGFGLVPIPSSPSRADELLEEALADNTRTPVPDQAAFRHDWPLWRRTRARRERRLLDDLMQGEKTKDVARKYGLSPARISQLRRQFHGDWQRFCGEPIAAGVAS